MKNIKKSVKPVVDTRIEKRALTEAELDQVAGGGWNPRLRKPTL